MDTSLGVNEWRNLLYPTAVSSDAKAGVERIMRERLFSATDTQSPGLYRMESSTFVYVRIINFSSSDSSLCDS